MLSAESGVVFLDHTVQSKCFSMFKSMRQNGEFCDIIMRFGSRAVSAHRVVIFAAFPLLREMFRNPEAGSEITLLIEPSVLESLIDFAYSCELEITNDNVEDLLSAALQLRTDEIQDACCDFISKQLKPQNVMAKLQFAENLCCPALMEKCRQFIRDHFDEVSSREDFLSVPLSFFRELISSDDLRILCEEKVFEAVMKWVRTRPDERTEHLPELLSHVRLTHVAPQYLIDHIQTEEAIRTSLDCRNLLDDAKYYHLMPQKQSQLYSLVTRPRKRLCVEAERNHTSSGGAGIYAISKQVLLNVQHLDPQSGSWKPLVSLPYPVRSGVAVSAADTVYYVDGGFLRSRETRDTAWISHNFMIDRFFAAGAILDDKIYVCGGRDGKVCLNTVECYDLVKRELEAIPPMSERRSLPAIVAVSGYLYVLGGHNGYRSVPYVERYDPVSRTWVKSFPMKTDRFGMGCTAHNGKIYVCGGYSTVGHEYLRSVEVYDPVNFQWNDLAPMNVERYQCSLVSCGGNLYAIGGCYEGDAPLCSTEMYDPEAEEWKPGPRLDPAQKYVQAVAVG